MIDKKKWVEEKLAELDEAYAEGKKKIESRSEELLKELEDELKKRERELLDAIKSEK